MSLFKAPCKMTDEERYDALKVMSGNILTHYDNASDEVRLTGRNWYASQRESLERLARKDNKIAADVVSALSPRTRWHSNVAYALACLGGQDERPAGCIGRNWQDALRARDGQGVTGPKRQAFSANLQGDERAVTVDVWAARAAGVTDGYMSLKGAYELVAEAYRLAASYLPITPAAMQATVWCHIRGAAA